MEKIREILDEAERNDAVPRHNAEREIVMHVCAYLEEGKTPPAYAEAAKRMMDFHT